MIIVKTIWERFILADTHSILGVFSFDSFPYIITPVFSTPEFSTPPPYC